MKTKEIGDLGETAVCHFLEALGYGIRARNYRVRGGEIDIVAEKDSTLCFVEVKTRRLGAMVSGTEAVNRKKQHRVIHAAYRYCHDFGIDEYDWFIRYDIAEVTMYQGRVIDIDYLESAFDETDFHDNSQIY